MVLTIRGLMGYVDGTEKRPDGSDPLALEMWLVREMEAKAQILLTLLASYSVVPFPTSPRWSRS